MHTPRWRMVLLGQLLRDGLKTRRGPIRSLLPQYCIRLLVRMPADAGRAGASETNLFNRDSLPDSAPSSQVLIREEPGSK